MYDIIIIGGGPAAATAAIYALGKQLNFLVIYAGPGKTGQTQLIAGRDEGEFLPGADAIRMFQREVLSHEGRALRDTVTNVQYQNERFLVSTQRNGVQEGMTVIVATGATPKPLNVPGASTMIGYGLGYSITTHAHILDGKRVAVIGTTTRALQGVAELSRTVDHLYLIAANNGSLRKPLAHVAHRPNVEVLEGYNVEEVIGTQSVEQLIVSHNEQRRRLDVDAAFVDLGLTPNSQIVHGLARLDTDGFIWVDETNTTSHPGLFAAGDVTTSFGEQTLIAIGDGARAALSAYQYLLAWLPLTHLAPVD